MSLDNQKNTLKTGLIFILFLASGFVVAQASEKLQPPKFHIELLVFEQTEKNAQKTGRLHEKSGKGALNLSQAIVVDNTLFENEALKLSEYREKIEKEQGLRVIYHHGFSDLLEHKKVFYLKSDQISPQLGAIEFEGTLALTPQKKHFYLTTNFIFKKSDNAPNKILEKALLIQPFNRFTLKESRFVHQQELHYFDHPEFGALVKVSKLNI